VTLGEHASCYKGAVTLPGRKHPVRHLLAVSQELHTNGSAGRTILLRYRREEAWATLVSFLGLPADPAWADHILGIVEGKKRIEEIDGIGCQPVLISATTEEVLEWIGDGLHTSSIWDDVDRRLSQLKDAQQMVVEDPEILRGTPVIRGTRIPVHDVASLVDAGTPA
jgi:hypothetical protein